MLSWRLKQKIKQNNINGQRIMMIDKGKRRKWTCIFTLVTSQEDDATPRKKWINSFGWDGSFCVKKKENGGNVLALAAAAALKAPWVPSLNWER